MVGNRQLEVTPARRGFFARFAKAIVVAYALLVPACLWTAYRVATSHRDDVRRWLPPRSEEARDLDQFAELFPSRETVLVSWPGCTLGETRLESFAEAIRREIGNDPAASNETGDGPAGLFSKVVTGTELLHGLTSEPLGLSRAAGLRYLKGQVVGPDDHTTCAIVTLSGEGSQNRHAVLTRISALLQSACGIPSRDVRIVGPTVQAVKMSRETDDLLLVYSPLTAAISVLLAFACLRRLRLVAILVVASLLVPGIGLALFYLAGGTMNALLMLLPALWFVLAVSTSIHLIRYYRDAVNDQGVDGAAGRALGAGWLPCTLATVTTAIGLGSLMISPIPTIREFGLHSMLGLTVGLVTLFLLLPSMLHLWGPPQTTSVPAGARVSRWWDRMTALQERHHAKCVVVFVALMVVVGINVTRLKTSFRLHDYFWRSSRLYRDTAWFEEHIGPLAPMEVVIRFPGEHRADFAVRYMTVAALQEELRSQIAEAEFVSAATVFRVTDRPRDMRRLVRRHASLAWLKNHRHFLETSGMIVYDEARREEVWRITMKVKATGETSYREFDRRGHRVVEAFLADLRREGDEQVSARLTGLIPLLARIRGELWDMLCKSVVLAYGAIALVMIVALRSLTWGFLAMLPNTFPLLVSFGAMGGLSIALNVGTIMTASIALGIAVDDTSHYLIWFGRGRGRGLTPVESARLAYGRCGVAMVQTSLICGLGLLIFLFSGFVPAARFALLISLILAMALIGDLLMLPALLITWPGRRSTDSGGWRSPCPETHGSD